MLYCRKKRKTKIEGKRDVFTVFLAMFGLTAPSIYSKLIPYTQYLCALNCTVTFSILITDDLMAKDFDGISI